VDFKLNRDLASNSYNDIVWVNGPLTKEQTTQPFTETVSQRLFIRLRTFREEWFMDTTYGVPYWQRILGFKNKKETVDLIFQEQILLERGVKEIVSFTSTFNNAQRHYSATFQVRVTNGEVTSPIVIQPIT